MLSFNRSRHLTLAVLTLCAAPLAGCSSGSVLEESGGDVDDDRVAEAASAVSESGSFQLRNVQAGTCLNVDGDPSVLNANAYQLPCNRDTGANLWTWLGTGEWRQLQNVEGGTCLNVENGSSAPDTNTHQYICDEYNGANLWKWEGTGSARQLRSMTGTCLNVTGGSSAPGTNTHQYTCNDGNDANKWVVEDRPGIGNDQLNAGTTCKTIHAAYPDAESGTFWIDPDGCSTGNAFQVYCDMVNDGGGWTKILHNTATSYLPSSGAVSDPSGAAISGFAKLSDAQINAIGASGALKKYRLQGDKTSKRLYLKTSNTYIDTARAMNLTAGTIQACEVSSLSTCTLSTITYPTIDTFESGLTGNDCDRFFTDHSATATCGSPGSGPNRCFQAGVSCSNHALIGGLSVWVREEPATDAPTSCAEVKTQQPAAIDGEYTLELAGGPASIYCADMCGTPKEYLTLQHTGGSANYAQYKAGGESLGSDVTTHYQKVRINPSTLVVDIGDQRFATSTGQLNHDGGALVTSMPFAVAMSCFTSISQPFTGQANIDLRDTPFAVAPNEFMQGGAGASGTSSYSSNDQVVDLTGRGICGWTNPQPYIYNPYNGNGGSQLDLVFAD